MIAVQLPVMAIALIPIVLIEAAVYLRLSGTSWSLAWRGSLFANAVSTFVGIPIAWFVQLMIQLLVGGGSAWGMDSPLNRLAAVTIQSAWLVPYEQELSWMIPAAAITLLAPFLLISVVVEVFVLHRYWPTLIRPSVTKNVIIANITTYSLLALFWGIQLYFALSRSDIA